MRFDKTLWILSMGLLVYSLVVIGVTVVLPGNKELYTLFAGILGAFSGGLFMYLKMQP